jgi:DNA-directed RNA polymerase subunit N (RpoN/RPB10)
MKINCLSCGHNVDLDEAYAENYEGAIKCYACAAVLAIKTEQGSLRVVQLCGPLSNSRRALDDDPLAEQPNGLGLDDAPPAHADKFQ